MKKTLLALSLMLTTGVAIATPTEQLLALTKSTLKQNVELIKEGQKLLEANKQQFEQRDQRHIYSNFIELFGWVGDLYLFDVLLDDRIDAVEDRLSGIEKRDTGFAARERRLLERVAKLETKLPDDIQKVNDRFDGIEEVVARVEALEKRNEK